MAGGAWWNWRLLVGIDSAQKDLLHAEREEARRAIEATWQAYEGLDGFLGGKQGDLHPAPTSDGITLQQDYQRGCIRYNRGFRQTGVYFRESSDRWVSLDSNPSAIMHEYYRLGGEPILGVPSTSGDRRLQTATCREFKTANGNVTAIFLRIDLHPVLLVRVDGLTWTCWMQRGGVDSSLGLPRATAEAATFGGRQGRMTLFDGGGIFEESGTSYLKLFVLRASDGVLEPLDETNEPLWRSHRSGQ